MKKIIYLLFLSAFVFCLFGCGEEEIIPELTFEETTVDLHVGDTYEIKPILNDTKFLEMVKYSIDGDMLELTGSTIKALKVGEAKVTVKMDDYPNIQKELLVKISEVPSLKLKGENEVLVGKSITLTCDLVNLEGTIIWKSSSITVATVSNGVVQGLKVGKTTITASIGEYSDEFEINIKPLPVLTVKGEKTVVVGKSITLTCELKNIEGQVTWSVNDTSIATIKDGVLSAIKDGKVTVTASLGEYTDEFEVTINKAPVLTIEGETEVSVGDNIILVCYIENSTEFETWSTSDADIATVEEGLVLGLKPGKVTITASLGEYEDSIEITVKVKTYKVVFKNADDSIIIEENVEAGKSAPAPTNPDVEGYVFKSWDTDFENVNSDLTIKPVFEAKVYNIKYFSGTNEITNTTNPKTYTIEDEFALAGHEITGYTFGGWYNNTDKTGEPITYISKGTKGDLNLYALGVLFDYNGGEVCWSTTPYTNGDFKNGIDNISNLPEMFEMDFFTYLSDNNLLTSSKINSALQATTWAAFSGLNPNHSGDPKRIWNDTSSNTSSGADGYIAVFLFETITLNSDFTIKNVEGGFLGTEPYKTKYKGLLSLLTLLQKYRTDNDTYNPIDTNTASSRALTGFLLDGYFYGTQGVQSSYFTVLRNSIPGTNYGFKLVGTSIEKDEYKDSIIYPVKEGNVFVGWYLDSGGTKKASENSKDDLCTYYAKWKEVK